MEFAMDGFLPQARPHRSMCSPHVIPEGSTSRLVGTFRVKVPACRQAGSPYSVLAGYKCSPRPV